MAEGELVRRGRSNISSQYVKEIENGNNAELALEKTQGSTWVYSQFNKQRRLGK